MIRLVLIIILLLLSLLSVFRAPLHLLWYAEILVTEFPWIFILAEVGLLLWGLQAGRYAAAGTVMAFISLALFLVPPISAAIIGRRLPEHMRAAGFGTADENKAAPFRFREMIPGLGNTIAYKSLVYTAPGVPALSLDFYASKLAGTMPCILVVHGGSWAGGNSKQLPEINNHLAGKGYHVASINYRLAPVHKSPAPVEDIRTALNFLQKEGSRLKIDTSTFILLGRSAGGQLVLTAAYQLGLPQIKGVISFYGPADMVWGAQHPANPLVFNSGEVLKNFLGGSYEEVPKAYVQSSPTTWVSGTSPPTLLLHGKNDVLVAYEHSVRLERLLEQFKVPHFLLTLPWATHGFDYTLSGPSGQLSTYCIERFLESVVAGKPHP